MYKGREVIYPEGQVKSTIIKNKTSVAEVLFYQSLNNLSNHHSFIAFIDNGDPNSKTVIRDTKWGAKAAGIVSQNRRTVFCMDIHVLIDVPCQCGFLFGSNQNDGLPA